MQVKLIRRLVGATALITLAPGIFLDVHAQIYTCKDKAGRMHTSDRPIPECADQAMREVQKSGVVRIIPAPLTAEQKRRLEAEQYQQQLSEAAAREQLGKDRALLASYSSVEEIEAGRRRAMGDTEEALARVARRIAELENERAANAREAGRYKNQPLPPSLQHRIEETQIALSLEEKNRAGSQADADRINKKYDAARRRYIELTKP